MSGEDSKSFWMGQFEATFPSALQYCTNHMWARQLSENVYRFGLTAYAVRLLQDVYFLDFSVEPGQTLTRRQLFGAIESKKAESDLFTPSAGTLIELNSLVLNDPSVINADLYGDGWLLDIELQDYGDLLDVDGYIDHLETAWEVAQRTIKGQI